MSFSAEPRPASAFPNPTRFSWIARRVGALNDWKMSSNCTGTCVWVMGSVPPSAITCCDVPLWRSTYLKPSTDDGRIEALEFTGTLAVGRREVQCQLRDGPAVGQLDRLHVRNEADPEAPFAHVAADREVRAAGDVDLELPRRHERQSAVGRVRQEHRDQQHQHGHCADQDRVREG